MQDKLESRARLWYTFIVMYREFYGLKEKPFNVTSDPSFLFLSRRHKEAFSHLIYGIEERKGFLEITGEIGTGKTTLCRALLNRLNNKTKTAFVFNPNLSGLQLLQMVMEDLGLKSIRNNKMELYRQLNKFLIEQLTLGNNVVLIVDEAQNLRANLLEEIRLLSNLETEKEKLIQIVLVGQPELQKKLDKTSLRQLKQRIGVRYHMLPLDKDEVSLYIQHRLKVAGSIGGIEFGEGAIDEIYNYSYGTPRLINILCDKALLLGYVLEAKTIDEGIIKKSVSEIEGIGAAELVGQYEYNK